MELIEQYWTPVNPPSYANMLCTVTMAASTCYQSNPSNKEKFVQRLIKAGHTSTIEHMQLTFRIVTDRAVSHELVRHRIASYSQESQRYCAYRKDVTFVIPHWVQRDPVVGEWVNQMAAAEKAYKKLLKKGVRPEDARSVLPNSTATTIVATFNIRSLHNFFNLRTSKKAHPDIRRLAKDMLKWCRATYPAFFPDTIGEV